MPDIKVRLEEDNSVLLKFVDTGDGYALAVATVGTSTSNLTKTDRSITASTTSQAAAAANTSRRRLVIKNNDAAISVFVNLGTAATTGLGSIEVAPKGYLEMNNVVQSVNVIAASGTPGVTIWEFQ